MKHACINGALAGSIAIAIMSATLGLHLSDHSQSIWFGYLVMFAAASLIFLGLKRFRDVERGGVLGFWRLFGLGVLAAAVAGLFYAVGWEIFIALSGYDFIAEYRAAMVSNMEATGATQAAIGASLAELEDMADLYAHPLIRMLMIFAEMFPVGLVVALVSAAILRKPTRPATDQLPT